MLEAPDGHSLAFCSRPRDPRPSYSSPLPLSFCNMNSDSAKSWGTPETWEQSPKTSPSP